MFDIHFRVRDDVKIILGPKQVTDTKPTSCQMLVVWGGFSAKNFKFPSKAYTKMFRAMMGTIFVLGLTTLGGRFGLKTHLNWRPLWVSRLKLRIHT